MIEGRAYSQEQKESIQNEYLLKNFVRPYREKLYEEVQVPQSQQTKEYYEKLLQRLKSKKE